MGDKMPRRFSAGHAVCLSIFLLSATIARAQDEALPQIEVLSCASACANSTPAKAILHPPPVWPREELQKPGIYIEGLVYGRFTVGVDGKPSDVHVLQLIGSPEFSKRAVEAVQSWTYEPATLNGKPVEQAKGFMFTFAIGNSKPGARTSIADFYRHATALVQDGKLDEAKLLLKRAMDQQDLNFYERSMLSYVLALTEAGEHNYIEAQQTLVAAGQFYRNSVSPAMRASMDELLIRSAIATNNLGLALQTWYGLRTVKDVDLSATAQLIKDTYAKAMTMPRILTKGLIGDAGEFYTPLSSRNFSFEIISGSLEKFTLICKQQTVTSRITETAKWTVPQDFSECALFVRGVPGATFYLVQTQS